MRKHLLLPGILLWVSVAAYSMDYQDLLAAVMAADPTMASLEVAERQADVSLRLSLATREALHWGFQSGEGKVEYSPSGQTGSPRFSVHPEVSLEFPRGHTAQFGVPLSASADGLVAVPSLGFSLPLLQKTDQSAVSARQLELAHDASLTNQKNRPLVLEKTLVERLIVLYRASAAVTEAQRRFLKAQVELTRAVSLDGAVPGGKAYLDGERAVRMATREVHRAESDYHRQQSELAILAGLTGTKELLPDEVPDVNLSAGLPKATSLPLVRQAVANLDLTRFRTQETSKDSTATAKVASGYGLGTGSGPGSLGTGLDLTSGLSFTSQEWTTVLDLGWSQFAGPRLVFSMAWKPLAPGEGALKREAASLEVLAQEQAVHQALIEGERSLVSLELRREQLLRVDQELAEDLEWASLQLVRYRDWQTKELVTQTEFDEVEATMQSVRTEMILNRLDRLAWALDRKLLLGEERE